MNEDTPVSFPTAQHVAGKFRFGERVMTTNALNALTEAFGDETTVNMEVARLFARHIMGDWGDIDAEDKAMNDAAIAHEGDPDRMSRVLSAYTLKGIRLWIVTEADRSVTTVLLVSDY